VPMGQWVIKLYDMMSQLERSINEHLSLGIHQRCISRMTHAMTEQNVRYSCRVLVSRTRTRHRKEALTRYFFGALTKEAVG